MFTTAHQIWRIWPAVALHIIFAAGKRPRSSNALGLQKLSWIGVVYMSFNTKYSLAIPPVLLTVLGERWLVSMKTCWGGACQLTILFSYRGYPRFRDFVSCYERVSKKFFYSDLIFFTLTFGFSGMIGTGWGVPAGLI